MFCKKSQEQINKTTLSGSATRSSINGAISASNLGGDGEYSPKYET